MYSGKYRSSGTYKCDEVVREESRAMGERANFWQFMLENVDFVEEKDDRRPQKPP